MMVNSNFRLFHTKRKGIKMEENMLKNRSLSLWYKALDAFEREYKLPNPIRQKSQELGRELTPTEFIEKEKIGIPLNHYPKDRIEEAYAFFVGYAGIPFTTYLSNIKNMRVNMDVNFNYNEIIEKIAHAHHMGGKAALEERRLDLESQVKQS